MKIFSSWHWGIGLLLLWAMSAGALEEAELLDPAQAFPVEVSAETADTVTVRWSIADGYYLYRERLRFESLTPDIQLGEPGFPVGQVKEDAFFGKIEIYRGTVSLAIPVIRSTVAQGNLELRIGHQGCADAGVCYPPQTRTVTVSLPAPAKIDLAAAIASTGKSLLPSQDNLLEPDQAFILSIKAGNPNTLLAHWQIADGYYLYRDKLKLELVGENPAGLTGIDLPAGEIKEDEFFGRQEVLYRQATATAHLQPTSISDPHNLRVRASYQGCAEIGVCLPPVSKVIDVALPLPGTKALNSAPEDTAPRIEAEQDRMARMLTEGRLWALPAFFGFGLLLAFTPCVFPMIPILSSLIAGQGGTLDQRRAFSLSLVYVLSMAVTYTLAGVLAGLLGQNIQALFQNTWIIAGISVFFMALALSMFGLYDLQLPSRWQGRLAEFSNRQPGGSYWGVAVMGLLSALIVSPCVAPPLIAILTVITATAHGAALGGAALFIMSLGMGLPLLIIGTSAGRWLPKAGYWMNQIKAVFGVMLLAVSLWMLERILPAEITMLLWAILLIVSATYMGALQPISHGMPAWRTLIKGLGTVMLIYGILLLVGVASGSKDTLQPLRSLGLATPGLATQTHAGFKTIKTAGDFDLALAEANGRTVMLDFYADWCTACKELDKYTFTDPAVQATLSDLVMLRADVTANDEADQLLLRRFGVIGPPAILFFGPKGSELKPYRLVGFTPAERFRVHLQQVLQR